jgi:SOUL heme-binding protein
MGDIIRSIHTFITSGVFFVLSAFGFQSSIEQPKYEVVERIGPTVEIRQYAPRIAAEATIDSSKSGNPRADAFRMVAAYIFGANKRQNKIAMTSPVEIETAGEKIAMTAPVEVNRSEQLLTMRFFMPARFSRMELPEPTDRRVTLVDIPSSTIAILRFSGSTDDAAVSERTAELLLMLSGSRWTPQGSPTALFYNPPWTIPFLRTNEIAIVVAK